VSDPAIQSLIREVLAEELAKLKPSGPAEGAGARQETVAIASSADLQAFAASVAERAADPAFRADVAAGRHQFQFAGPGSDLPSAEPGRQSAPAPPDSGTVSHGMVTERHIDRLPNDMRTLQVGRSVRLTPLARDRARQRGIKIERLEQ